MAKSRDEAVERLEEIMDWTGVSVLMGMLADIANGKADHLQSNWQDYAGARRWQRLANRLANMADSIDDPYTD